MKTPQPDIPHTRAMFKRIFFWAFMLWMVGYALGLPIWAQVVTCAGFILTCPPTPESRREMDEHNRRKKNGD